MKVIIACEYAGYPLKVQVLKHLREAGHEVIDLGQKTEDEKILYPDVAAAVARAVQDGVAEKAVLICGTGAGVSVVANKFKGVYCIVCESLYTAGKIPIINNANVLAMGGNVVGPGEANDMVDIFLANSFAKGMPQEKRDFLQSMFDDVRRLEEENFK